MRLRRRTGLVGVVWRAGLHCPDASPTSRGEGATEIEFLQAFGGYLRLYDSSYCFDVEYVCTLCVRRLGDVVTGCGEVADALYMRCVLLVMEALGQMSEPGIRPLIRGDVISSTSRGV